MTGTRRFPWIGEAALKNRIRQFVLDGEAVILGVDGISDLAAGPNALRGSAQASRSRMTICRS